MIKRNAAVAVLLSFALALGGCGFIKDKLQSGVDDLNKGIEDTAKSVGEQINSGVEDNTEDIKEDLGGTASGEAEPTGATAVEPATEAAPK